MKPDFLEEEKAHVGMPMPKATLGEEHKNLRACPRRNILFVEEHVCAFS